MSDDKLQSAEAEVVCGKIIGEQPPCLPVRVNKNQQIKKSQWLVSRKGVPLLRKFITSQTCDKHCFINEKD